MAVSPFLERPSSEWVASNALAFAIRDAFPVSPGHTLVIPRRLVGTWFDATREEQLAVLELVDEVKRQLDASARPPDGYNVGFNAGVAAGQTVMHLHVHVIPRYHGDMDDPRGGVRHVLPSEGNYVAQRHPLATGGEADPFAQHVLPLLARATEVAIVAAFTQETGLRRIEHALDRALSRGASVRIVTGDYLEITQANALATLLDWQRTAREGDENPIPGRLEARVVEAERLPGRTRAFHPKAWWLEGEGFGVAFVGSSNLSLSALETGIEWNLRVDRDRDRHAYERVRSAFEELWALARPLDAAWVAAYAERVRRRGLALPPGEVEPGVVIPPATPHDVQQQALARLRQDRAEGRRRALVVLATGLGKTWLAAFDLGQLWDELGRQPRLLFVAHRREILRQAADTYRRLFAERGVVPRVGWFAGDSSELEGDLVFASIVKLARAEHRARLAAERFDYVVIDEVHHAAARSYREVLGVLDPLFLLGLTATPDRADAADILGLFDDHEAFRADIAAGISVGRLVPFHYQGVRDDIDYAAIPWRNRRFDPEALASAAQTEERMRTLWSAWQAHPGTRTLVFCCSVPHADYVRSWLRGRGVRVEAVYAAEGSDDRDDALAKLARGELDALCAIDVFNEGVDVPSLDRVVMLRPTESGVVFLQQLGRGLRASEDKTRLQVIDFVGNHRVFLERLRTLLSLAGDAGPTMAKLLATGEVELPAGCSVTLELEAKGLLESLFRVGGADAVERAYRELRLLRGQRPTAGELYRMGANPKALRARHGSWFRFVQSEGDLSAAQSRALEDLAAFLGDLETTPMTKSFKMVTLEALLEAEALTSGLSLRDLALRSAAVLRRDPQLLDDVPVEERLPEVPDEGAVRGWMAYWRKNPVAAWTEARPPRRAWFGVEGDRFVPRVPLSSEAVELVRELVDYRLATYRRRNETPTDEGFVCRVTWNKRDPILKLPSRTRRPIPEGEHAVRLPDGSVWLFRFMKEFVNVARPPGADRNALPDLLRRWFGPTAGHPGTAFDVRFVASPDGLWVEPVQAQVVELPTFRGIVAYPDLRAAAGHGIGAAEAPEAERVLLPVEPSGSDVFAVRVAGSSMDGGREPLRDGDWAVMRFARGAPAKAVEGRVALVQLPAEGGYQWVIKRVKPRPGGWELTSDNPDGPTLEATEEMVVVARLVKGIRPEELAPARGTVLRAEEVGARFGIEGWIAASGRQGGHLFVVVDRAGVLVAPDAVRGERPRPGETAFVLAGEGEALRYLGVGRWRDGLWRIPEVDFAMGRQWGEGRQASRALPDGALVRAQGVVDAVLAIPEGERWIERDGERRARVLGAAARGGLRIDGGEGGFEERTVSLVDLAWVGVAAKDVLVRGGRLDEERVNRLRYLEGTPKGSTRWIDTGWALAAWARLQPEAG